MRANVYCGNLLWQSSLTLPAPLYDLYKKLRQYLEKPPVTCDCVKPIYIYEGERDNDGKDSGTSVMLETDWVDRPESDFKYQLEQ